MASEFESRQHGQLRLLVFATALLGYLVDRDDIVWRVLHWHSPREAALARLIFGFAALLVGLAASLETWALACSEAAYTYSAESALLTANGPFRHVRHPLRLGEILFAAGMAFLLSTTGAVIALAGTALINLRLIARDEAKLERRMGNSFRTLCQLVPRLVPTLHPRIPSGTRKPKWLWAVRSKASHWGCLLMMVVFSITLRDPLAWILAGAAFLAGFLLNIRQNTGQLDSQQSLRHISLWVCALTFVGGSRAEAPYEHTHTGAEIFRVRCANCHATGSQTMIGPGLHGILESGRFPESEVRDIVKNGRKSMPPLGDKLSDRDLEQLIQYLKTL
jgi:protein-S-isoprenylcysteine O-methyltransferase Ste14/cytochrome c5